MRAGRTSTLLAQLYDHVELALWASLVAGLVVFALFVVPGIPAAQQRNEAAQRRRVRARVRFLLHTMGHAGGHASPCAAACRTWSSFGRAS